MRFSVWAAVLALGLPAALNAQSSAADYVAGTEHPRLILKPQRLRLLRRERERESMRWLHFASLMEGKARMPEPLFAAALHRAVVNNKSAPPLAVSPAASIREVALVADWTAPEDRALLDRLRASLSTPVTSFAHARDRAFAAIVLGDGRAMLELVETWWRGKTAPRIERGEL
ncbi:MAG TPA: hypothetical protein VES20_06845, partial [Bryobacteraceae bacterium]|nr:hypothetical protein [Bryobacteraceae bacterium]